MEQHPDSPRAGAPAPDAAPDSTDEAAFDPAHLPLPWEGPDPEEDPGGARVRHDAFTARRKNAFLRALQKTGCVLDAARAAGVSPRTVYRHQGMDAEFLEHCTLAVSMCEVPLEISAWKRGVTGIEEQVVVGGRLVSRVKRSDSILRLLLQGSNPKKYGPQPGFKRKRLLKQEKKQIEREVRAELQAKMHPRSLEEVRGSILRKLSAMEGPMNEKRLAEGWTRTEAGHWIPPGYGRIAPPEEGAERAPPCNSV